MDLKVLTQELEQLEQRYQDGYLQSDVFWRILIIEIGLLEMKYERSHDCMNMIVSSFKRIEQKMNCQKSQINDGSSSEKTVSISQDTLEAGFTEKKISAAISNKKSGDNQGFFLHRRGHKSPYQR